MAGTTIEIGEDVRVRRDGDPVALPKSKKTRALLAYLMLESRPVRRERLCEMFWDRSADPRASLRWSLSKIRRALGEDAPWLAANRNDICLSVPDEQIAWIGEPDRRLEALASGAHDDFSLWLAAQRRTHIMKGAAPSAAERSPPARQTIRYTHAEDGTRLAYAVMGAGRPLLKAANWLTHLDAELESPVWGDFYRAMAAFCQLHRYDERGNGLSDWEVADFSFEAWVRDLEIVADAADLGRVPLLGISQGGAVCIEYACRHPERVSGLILIGAYPAGWRANTDPKWRARRAAEVTLVRHGWGDNNPAYRQIFSHSFLPDASAEEIDAFNEFQRQTTSAENAARFLDTFGDIDVRHRLSEVSVPVLVLHARDDERVAMKVGADLAAALPDATFQSVNSSCHMPQPRDPAFAGMIAAIRRFLDELPA
ncbi:MAG: alpha/beta fold hydrolase [Pseudomonadota bacterium]